MGDLAIGEVTSVAIGCTAALGKADPRPRFLLLRRVNDHLAGSSLSVMDLDRYSTDAWLKAFRHEAGHAVAALSRERPVNEILLNSPFDGFTSQGCKGTPEIDDDYEFVLWAGPWAEARTTNELAGIADTVPTFDQVHGFLEQNDGDRAGYRKAIEGKAPPREAEWGDVLDGLWDEIKTLATKLRDLNEVIELGHGHSALHRINDRPTHWRRKDWTPPGDYVDEWMEELHSGLGKPV